MSHIEIVDVAPMGNGIYPSSASLPILWDSQVWISRPRSQEPACRGMSA
jgi:hypothetical protein